MRDYTPNGYDPRWIAAINAALEDRRNVDDDPRVIVSDLDDALWEMFIAPMLNYFEDVAI